MTPILLIDDHPLFCRGFKSTCETLRPQLAVSVAVTVADAISQIGAGHSFALILIDLLLPDGDGFSALQSLSALDPLTPRIVVSGRDDRSTRLRARQLGASGFISKSLESAAIMTALDTVLEGGVYFDGAGTGEPDAEVMTPRQLEVLDLLAQGCANKEIEDRLGLADRTVRAHLTEIFKVLGVQSRIRAVMEARRRGLIP